MVKIVNPPDKRVSRGVTFYQKDGLDYARVSKNALYRQLLGDDKTPEGLRAPTNVLQRALGNLRGQFIRNFKRTRQGIHDIPDFYWNSGKSFFQNNHPEEVPKDSPKEFLEQLYPGEAWSNAISRHGIWHTWEEFAPDCLRALEIDYEHPQWIAWANFRRNSLRFIWKPIPFRYPEVPDFIIPPEAAEALCFIALGRTAYPVGEINAETPPSWCQYYLDEDGQWEVICFQPNKRGNG